MTTVTETSHYSSEPVARLVPVHGYGSPSEELFDDMVVKGDLDTAQETISQLMTHVVKQVEGGFYPNNFFRVAIKEIAMPFYAREVSGGSDTGVDAERVYPDAIAFMKYLDDLYTSQDQTTMDKSLKGQFRGDFSELAAFALTSRYISGGPNDTFNIVPSTLVEDRFSRGYRGAKTRFDYTVRYWPTMQSIPLQVKSSSVVRDIYTPDIAIARMQTIAGGGDSAIHKLNQAMIAEVEGDVSSEQKARLDRVARNLFNVYYEHLNYPSQDTQTL